MFKSLSLLIYKTPWWGMWLGGGAILLALVMFALRQPALLSQLSEQASTQQEKSAIAEEILQAQMEEGSQIFVGMVSVFQFGALTPDSRSEWDRFLLEVERGGKAATKDSSGQGSQTSFHDAMRKARLTGVNTALEAAQSALKTAQEARQKIEAARDEALQRLREKGQDLAVTVRSFDPQLQDAKQKEVAAQVTVDGLVKARAQEEAPTPAQSPELKNSIHAATAQHFRRMGVTMVLGVAYVLLFLMLVAVKSLIDRSQRALLAAKEEVQAIDLRRQMTEARLQMLQAQVEPHYLYNTLANVQALTEVDPPAANKLVGNLIDYLRAALPKMRESTSTVGQEVERVRAYLNILKIRMGDRLAFEIQVHDALLKLPLPPMMLPTLVENAIKHGLEPKREGGRIDVWVTRERRDGQDRLLLLVRDTGMGLSEQEVQSGSGVGLSNLHERLRALYGDNARFTLESNEPCGALATLDIPAQVQATFNPNGGAQGDKGNGAAPQGARSGGRRIMSKIRSLSEPVISSSFFVLMLLLLVGIFLGLLGLSGWLPTSLKQFRIEGLAGTAVGSMGLLMAFCAMVVVLLRFGMGSLVAGLLLVIPFAILIYSFPALSLSIPIGLVIYWMIYWIARKKRRNSPDNRQRTNGI